MALAKLEAEARSYQKSLETAEKRENSKRARPAETQGADFEGFNNIVLSILLNVFCQQRRTERRDVVNEAM